MLRNRYLKIIALPVSAAFYFVSCLTGNMLLSLFGIPFFLNAIILIHECGHAFFCLINKNHVKEIRIPFAVFKEGKIAVNTDPGFRSYCLFVKSGNDIPVYVGGPFFSFAAVLILFVVWAFTRNGVLLVSATAALLHWIKNLVPIGESDANMIIKEFKKQRRSEK